MPKLYEVTDWTCYERSQYVANDEDHLYQLIADQCENDLEDVLADVREENLIVEELSVEPNDDDEVGRVEDSVEEL